MQNIFTLKPFQDAAITKLKSAFLNLWQTDSINLPLVFRAPTGSGKTIMVAQFLRDLIEDPRFTGNDIAFVWLTFSEQSYLQSKDKLFHYYGGAAELNLLDLNDMQKGKLDRNNVFFINWQKLKGHNKDSRKLRRQSERLVSFDEFMLATHKNNRKIVAIIDEEHIGADTDLALNLVNDVISPKIILRISATPKYIPAEDELGAFVDVPRSEVIESGLIREKVVFQTEEDLNSTSIVNLDQDELLLELAFMKRAELLEKYKELNSQVNPLVLIQLPNDDKANSGTDNINKLSISIDFLKQKGISDSEIAIWLSDDKVNLNEIEAHDSPVSFLLFKQAAATGWDCPRASVLVMFREIKNPIFTIQTVGRILRMPFGNHFPTTELNQGYLYTNYTRNEVLLEYAKTTSENRPAIYKSILKSGINPVKIESTYISRADYNDLGDSFQLTFKKTAEENLPIKSLVKNPVITNSLIIGVEIDDFDNFVQELMQEGENFEEEISRHDLERLYNLLCFKIIASITDMEMKFAPERSWSKLKTALNIYLMEKLALGRSEVYKIVVKDLLDSNSLLLPVIHESLKRYRPIRENEVNKRVENIRKSMVINTPPAELYFTDLYEMVPANRCAHNPFWVEKQYLGRKNEMAFFEFIDKSSQVEWWFKNQDYGSEYFAISYLDPEENRFKLFYPDWIIKTRDKIMIIETKSGMTAESLQTKYKAEALQKWLSLNKNFSGGVAVQDNRKKWKINLRETYSYDSQLTGWDDLIF